MSSDIVSKPRSLCDQGLELIGDGLFIDVRKEFVRTGSCDEYVPAELEDIDIASFDAVTSMVDVESSSQVGIGICLQVE